MERRLLQQEAEEVSPSHGDSRLLGIVLAGTYHWSSSRFEALMPRPVLPVAQSPLICYALRWLRGGGISRATACTNSASRAVRESLGNGSDLGLELDYHEDPTPRGAAGCVRDAAAGTDADTLVIADGTAIPSVRIGPLLAEHFAERAALTIVVHPERHSGGGERPLSPGGLYVMDRRVLDLIAEVGFQDIKENLIARLYRAGERVVTHEAPRPCPRVLNSETYLAVNQWMVARLSTEPTPLETWGDYRILGDAIAHATAWVHPSARIVGPVQLGPGACVLAGATLVGPATVAADSQIGEGAMLSRSVVWNRCTVGARAVVDGCILADDTTVAADENLFHILKVSGTERRRFPEVFAIRGTGRRELPHEGTVVTALPVADAPGFRASV